MALARLRFDISISLDGYVAGPDQSEEHPLGKGGMQLHEWAFELEAWRKPHGRDGGAINESTPVIEAVNENIGAEIMGRGMFGGGPGPWPDPPWNGWWGDEPPFHEPVFVLTHHEREPLEMKGGTTFHFVTEGIKSALERAFEAADGKDVKIGGGAQTAQQYLAAGLLDELQLHLVPLMLGAGERLFDNLGDLPLALEQQDVIEAPGVTHLTYRIAR